MRRAATPLLLLALALCALAGCGESPAPPAAPPVTEGRATGENSPQVTPVQEEAVLPRPGESAGPLAEVTRLVDEQLAGLRGKAAVDYARKALEKRLPEEVAARREILLVGLQTGTVTERWLACLAAPTLGTLDDEFFRALLQQTQAPVPHVQAAALDALRTAPAFEDAAIERMWRVVGSAAPPLRSTLLQTLGRLRQDARRKPDMLRALQDESAEVRAAAAFALSQLDLSTTAEPWPHEDVRAALTAALADPDPQVRWWALLAFPRMGTHARASAGKIAEALHDPEARLQSAATSALLALGPDMADVLAPRIVRATRQEIEGLAYLLRRLGGEAATDALRAGLNHADTYVQVRCAMALQARKVKDLDAPALFAEALANEDPAVVLLALEGLGESGPEAAPYLDRIEALRTNPNEDVRRAASVLGDLLGH